MSGGVDSAGNVTDPAKWLRVNPGAPQWLRECVAALLPESEPSDAEKLREIEEVVGFWRSFGENNAGVRQICKTVTRILNGEPPDPADA